MNQVVQEQASILVVDDNPLIVNVLTSLLGSANYRVFSSSNGKEALQILENKEVDVIICDVMMPEMVGYDLHNQVRNRAELAHIPFVFLTALGGSDEVNHGKEIGADDYVIKPFDPKNLLAVVKGKVERSRSLRSSSDSRYDAYRRKVIHTLSHEFRTPLVAINTGAELLLGQHDRIDNKKIQNLLEAIHRGGQRLEHLVSDFMLLQQIEAGIAEQMFKNYGSQFGVGETLEHFLEGRLQWIEGEGFRFRLEDLCEHSQVHVYEPQLHDILFRLTSNAIKFSTTEKLVEFYAYPCSEEVVIEIRDRGLGINVAKIKEAIDLFGQIDRDKLEQQGGGLGLAIASRYANINGGRIEFERRQGGGTTASVILPLVKSAA